MPKSIFNTCIAFGFYFPFVSSLSQVKLKTKNRIYFFTMECECLFKRIRAKTIQRFSTHTTSTSSSSSSSPSSNIQRFSEFSIQHSLYLNRKKEAFPNTHIWSYAMPCRKMPRSRENRKLKRQLNMQCRFLNSIEGDDGIRFLQRLLLLNTHPPYLPIAYPPIYTEWWRWMLLLIYLLCIVYTTQASLPWFAIRGNREWQTWHNKKYIICISTYVYTNT